MAVHKRDVARALEEIGRYLQIEERNRFRSMAYLNAARQIDSLQAPIEELVRSGEIYRTPGIGKATGQVIEEIVRTGTSRYLEELRSRYPSGLFELLRVPTLGLRKIGVLHKELGISNLDDLVRAIQENRLLTLRGFGPKTQQKITEAIEFFRAQDTRWLLPKALRFAEMLREHLEKLTGIEQVGVAGSIRRRLEIVRNVNLCIATRNLTLAARGVTSVDFLDRAEQVDQTLIRAQSRTAMPVEVRLCKPEEFPTSLFFATGSKDFVESIVAHARGKGFTLTPEGLTKAGRRISLAWEDELFKTLGVAVVAPELREEPPKNLRARRRFIDVADLRGAFHVHTTFSDGKATVYEMLEAAASLGFAYVGMSDHSPTAYYARGLTKERLAEQHAEIDKHARAFAPMRIFKGTESDILLNGELDYPPEILAGLDFVVASVHSRFKMGPEEMTERILRAIRNPFTTFLGHLTGRLLLSREGYRVDYDSVFAEAAKQGVILEINGNPHRLDLDWRQMQRALSHGVRFSIHPDAHSVAEMNHIVSGVWNARKGGLGREHIFNTLPLEEVERHLAARRRRALSR